MNDKPTWFYERSFVDPQLTRRELFAAMAMQGWLACPLTGQKDDPRSIHEECAAKAVAYANALIAELEKSDAD